MTKQSKNIKIQKTFIAFTLAEVLITLSIIGVVAAMTVPALQKNMNNAQYVVGLKKAYSVVSSAVKKMKIDNGSVMGAINGTGSNDLGNAMCRYLNCTKICLHNESGCWNASYKTLDGNYEAWHSTDNNYFRAELADGSLVLFSLLSGNCDVDRGDGPLDFKTCGYYMVDVNGYKKPNVLGRDVFAFYLARDGIFPIGSYYSENWRSPVCCDPTQAPSSTEYGGVSCAARILKEGAMNY